ncbi:hypothetical protein QBC34DRAFT_401508 [Podospora aff. communis PSN243]|uniref:Heterokaryon incompatibility domain-containing protein n=1 Tax=Podospora aff. communis PSN243 TaxID=3040156 RepID=A0AAV9GUZ4_9PEZI|nr:hypothetical protein QBC34DRAFT_401508 [Podospora aff. communis PSN243]
MRLFMVSPDSPLEGQRLQINGTGWGLLEHDISLDLNPPSDFICISYSWGTGTSASPFYADSRVSDRTLPVLLTAVTQRPTLRKIWIDAYCVPPTSESSLRESTLQSMGFIYSRASEVLVVLTSRAIPALQQATGSDLWSAAHLAALEAEDWVTRAWTYQEAVNARRLSFTCQDSPPSTAIDIMRFFSRLGNTLTNLPPAQRKLYPRLCSLEELLSDCVVAEYLERSALQVMTAMDERTQTRPDDRFYAMMGAISTEPAKAVEGVGPCEAFMRLCERTGDYSFLFCKEDREERTGRRWRPVEGMLNPVISWHCSGPRLRGRLEGGAVTLQGVAVLELGELGEKGRTFMKDWLAGFERMGYGSWPDLEPERAVYKALRRMKFSGSADYLATEYGLVFSQSLVPQAAKVNVIVAAEIRWTFGAPSLIQFRDSASGDGYHYEAGLFFGRVPAGDMLTDITLS